MSKRQILMLLGLWVMAFLFLGFPSAWDKVIALVSGLVIIGVSYFLNIPASSNRIKDDAPFVEHRSSDQVSNQTKNE